MMKYVMMFFNLDNYICVIVVIRASQDDVSPQDF